jgi:C-terminal processing protease CtpA/Prc
MQIYGDKGYVVAVKPGCDAEAKGIKVGDMVHSISGYQPSRELMWKLKYLFYTLRPQPGLRLVVQSPNSQPREVEMLAKITQGQRILDLTGDGLWQYLRDAEAEDRLNRHRYYEAGEEAFIWKMPQFDLTDSDIDMMMEKAKKRKALILDLRGNGGGAVVTLQRLVANVLDKDIKIADLEGRKEMKPMLAKTRGADRVFKGKIVVLIDHESGSAAEIFARIMQLEKRGTVIGNRSAGAVMQSKFYQHEVGADTVVPYGASITDANLIMADGKSLEKIGVSPDEIVLPTGADLAAKRDPVLSRAAALLELALDPEKAGMMFPTEWRK